MFLDALVRSEYSVVLYLTELEGSSMPGLTVLQSFHKSLPRDFKKNIKEILLVHSTWQTKVTDQLYSTALSPWLVGVLGDHPAICFAQGF